MKAITMLSMVFVLALTLTLGYIIGRVETIHQAELISVDDHEYHIGFGDEIHIYTKEVNPNE